MLPTIITGGTSVDRANYIARLRSPQVDLRHITPDTTSITIKQVHALIDSLSISARLPRLIWIEEANLLTIPAQNALLKLLEEPPGNTHFYLTCSSASSLLPTIRSRAQLVSLTASDTPDPLILTDLKSIMNLPVGERLSQIPKLDRPHAQAWFKDVQTSLRLKLSTPTLSTPQQQTLAKIAGLAQTASLQLGSNVGVGLVYESFYLHLPKTK